MLLKKERLQDLLDALARDAQLYIPKHVDGVTRYALYTSEDEPAFEVVNTVMPPKDLLFPQTQKMYRFGFDSEGTAFIDPCHDDDRMVLFGVRSCDMRSIECMDDVFLSKGYVDDFYAARRAGLLTVAMACTAPAPTCFCDSMGLEATHAPGADIQLTGGPDVWSVAAQTQKGIEALASWEPFLEEGELPAELAAPVSCSLAVNIVGVREKLEHMYEHPIWEQLADKCLTCGTCTYLCPTCHCFDISQENRAQEGLRFRCWDSCMFSEYTQMAGGHNPRPSKEERVRNRFMHKLCFFEDRYGKMLCVGCGRCVEKCPVAVDITCLIDEIGACDVAR